MATAHDADRFDSWKEIADHLKRHVRTVRRWERERALPVHRLPGAGRRAVFGYRGEIDEWLRSAHPESDRNPEREVESPLRSGQPGSSNTARPQPPAGSTSLELPILVPTGRAAPRVAAQANAAHFAPLDRGSGFARVRGRWGIPVFLAAMGAGVILGLLVHGRGGSAGPGADANPPATKSARTGQVAAAGWKPEILSVRFSGEPRDLGIELGGLSFGQVAMRLPFTGDVRWFHIGNVTCYGETPGRCEAGYTGDVYPVTYRSWSDNHIVISHYGAAEPGDALELVVWNPQSKNNQDAAVWGGNVPPTRSGTPQISKVTFGRPGRDLEITIEGSNFGKAPPGLPGIGNTAYLEIGDFAFHSPRVPFSTFFRAGYTDRRVVDAITLVFSSWADNKIVIGGFAGAYGRNGMVMLSGDPISIELWNTTNHLATAWGGRVP